MSEKIVKEEEIKQAIVNVMKKYKHISSQHELAFLVIKELRKKYPSALLSSKRARIIALTIPQIKVKVITKKSQKAEPKTCPACQGRLKGLYAVNLLNKKVLVGLQCEKCGYKGSLKSFEPYKYEFYFVE
jgi:hypothetical protein